MKIPRIFVGLAVTLALMVPMSIIVSPVSAYDVGMTKGVAPTTPNMYRLGDIIHYTMSIVNISHLTGVNEDVVVEAVWDVLPDGTVVYPTGPSLPYTLHPGQTQSYTYDWVATRTGVVVNTFYARGYQITPLRNDAWQHSDQKSSLVIDPRIDVEKYVWDGANWRDADDTGTLPYLPSTQDPVVFAFEIDNTGDVDLTSVNLTDTHISTFYSDQACTTLAVFPIPTLTPTDPIVTVYGKLTWAPGQHSNNATATGGVPIGPPVSDTDPTYYFGSAPSIDLEKYVWNGTAWDDADTAPGPSLISAQNPVVFRFIITNDDNVSLANVTLADSDILEFFNDQACTSPANLPTTLAAGQAKTYYGKLAWAQGQHANNATATATPPVGPPISDSDPAHYLGAGPSIDLEKHVWNGTAWDDADPPPGPSLTSSHNPIVFRFVISNSGNVELTSVNLTDTDMSTFYTDQNCTINATFPTTLAVSETKTYYSNLTWAQGQHSNNATATGAPPVADPVSDSDPAHYFGLPPSIELEKAVWNGTAWDDADTPTGPSLTAAHNPVLFRFIITNNCGVNLTSVNLTDTDMSAFYTDQNCTINATFPTTLTVSETKTYYSNLTWAQGQHSNNATATGTPPVGDPVSDSDPAHYFGLPPSIELEKAVWNGTAWDDADTPTGPSLTAAHNPVLFRFVIANNCGVNLTSVNLTDTDMSAFYTDQNCTINATFPTTLAVSETKTYYSNLTWAQGQHSNNATATGTPPVGDPVSDSDLAHYFGLPPSIDVEKHVWTGSTWDDADTPTGPSLTSDHNPVVFRFIITNNCGVNLTNVTLSDTHITNFYTDQGLTNPATLPIATLITGTSVAFYGGLPWAAGQHSDTATAAGTPPVGEDVSDSDPAHYFGGTTPVGWETYPVDKVRVLLPWIGLLAAIAVSGALLVLRRRRLI